MLLESVLTKRLLLLIGLLFLQFLNPPALHAQSFKGQELVQAELISNVDSIVPGQPFLVGLRLKIAPHWHVYWEYAGDAGIPTTIKWNLPEGFKAGAFQWPIPEKYVESGDLVTYAYSNEVMLLIEITPPPAIASPEISLGGDAKWLVCETTCIPGKASVSLTLPVREKNGFANKELFERYQKQIPKSPPPFNYTWQQQGENLLLKLEDASNAEFFPLPAEEQLVGHPQPVASGFQIPLKSSLKPGESLHGVLVTKQGESRTGWIIENKEALPAGDSKIANPVSMDPGEQPSLLKFLFFGVIGGFILNLMPCVLPVIALKMMGFVKQAGESRARIFRLGLAFVAGIFVWFLTLALLVAGFKAAGSELNWAFQFQNSYFLIGMAAVLLVFALNLFGVFEIFLPGKTGTHMLNLASREGYFGAFMHGIFATLLATPCTAPFLGTVLGFAFTQSISIILIVFSAIAFGMALPYLLLAAFPAWMRFLPKPGLWMERLKQFMGFLLLATVIWLLGVIGSLKGLEGLIWASWFLLILGIASWMKGVFMNPGTSTPTRIIATLIALALVIGSGFYFIGNKFANAKAASSAETTSEGGIPWESFSPEKLETSLQTGQPVFIDFTADWCLNCKFNEKFILETEPIQNAFKQHKIIAIKADWTNGDPEITKILKQHQRAGVPMYLFYPGKNAAPVVFPEILTQKILLEEFKKLSLNETSS